GTVAPGAFLLYRAPIRNATKGGLRRAGHAKRQSTGSDHKAEGAPNVPTIVTLAERLYRLRPCLRRLVSASELLGALMIHVTFPDGAKRAYELGVSGLEIAKSISPSLAKRAVAAVRNGEVVDLADPIDRDSAIEFISRDDPRALE